MFPERHRSSLLKNYSDILEASNFMLLLKRNSQEYHQSLPRADCFESKVICQKSILVFSLLCDLDLKTFSVGVELKEIIKLIFSL